MAEAVAPAVGISPPWLVALSVTVTVKLVAAVGQTLATPPSAALAGLHRYT